jgi:hypothetical protein
MSITDMLRVIEEREDRRSGAFDGELTSGGRE